MWVSGRDNPATGLSIDLDGFITFLQRKALDVNKYATKKTIAQGMLDIALLTANASQLKYILQVGRKHEFYTLMLGLIITSLILQVSKDFSFTFGSAWVAQGTW